MLFDPNDLNFHALTLPDGTTSMSTYVQVDSLDRIHRINIHSDNQGFDYQMSTDGGKTWQTLTVAYPPYTMINTNTGGQVLDFRVNAALGLAAIITRVDVGSPTSPPQDQVSPQQDYVYKIDISGTTPKLFRRYTVGDGDTTVDNAYLGTYETGGHRYDFASIAFLPDGRVATSFMDEHGQMPFPTTGNMIEASAVAIELPQQAVATPEAPWVPWLLIAGIAATGGEVVRRRRRRARRAALEPLG